MNERERMEGEAVHPQKFSKVAACGSTSSYSNAGLCVSAR